MPLRDGSEYLSAMPLRKRIQHQAAISLRDLAVALPPLATEERTFGIGSSVPEPAVSDRSKAAPYSITSSVRGAALRR